MRVAIVHERFSALAGSERVVEQLHALWPDAEVHAPIIDPVAVPAGMAQADLRPGALQRLYRGGQNYAYLLPLLPVAMARTDLSGAELVVTSHHAFANRVRPPRDVPVVSYTHTPARWIWDPSFLRNEVGGTAGRIALTAFARTQRRPDAAAAQRTRSILVNSNHVATRVRQWWNRPARVVPPPVDVDHYCPDPAVEREPFFLMAGRLVPYKRPEVAVTAAAQAGARLVVTGEGRMRKTLEGLAGPTVEFLGKVDDATLLDLYRRCTALVFPGEEDFGMVPVEAQACGTPVIARGIGGVLDTVEHNTTGHLYVPDRPGSEVEALAGVMASFDPSGFDATVIRSHAERFSAAVFRERISEAVEEVLAHPRPVAE